MARGSSYGRGHAARFLTVAGGWLVGVERVGAGARSGELGFLVGINDERRLMLEDDVLADNHLLDAGA